MESNSWKTVEQGGFTFSRYLMNYLAEILDTETGNLVSKVLTGKPQYKYVNLHRDDGKRVLRRVHNILAWTFLGDPPTPKHTADHIDQDKFNNGLDNIRWADKKTQILNRSITILTEEGIPLQKVVDNLPPHYSECSRIFIKNQMNLNNKTLLEAKVAWSESLSTYIKVPENLHTNSWEYEGVWYPVTKTLVAMCGSVSKDIFLRNIKDGLSIKEALHYKKEGIIYENYFEYDGYEDNFTGHCKRLCVSEMRIHALISKHNITFEEAVIVPVQRKIKHSMDGVVMRNKAIFEKYKLSARNATSYMAKKKDRGIRETLEYYGVDTSDIQIHLCDGDIIMWNSPI